MNEHHKVASITRVENVIFDASVKDLETSLILSVKGGIAEQGAQG